MSGTYTSDEKVEFALKTALFRTMQSKDQPTSLEDPAPPRIFPNNIMKVNLIEKGEGDIDEDGYYVGRANSASAYLNDNNLVDLEKAELVISNYRIIDPSNNVVTNKRVSDLTTVNLSQTSITAINALPTTGTVYPKKNWFFRGHYGSDSGTTAFNNASSSYDGLQLAWDKSTVGATPTEADIVPHLKFYLQVQTKYTNVAHGDNISYAHDLMKGLIGLDQGFTTTLKVNQGEGGSCATLGATGTAEGNFWFTQATSGTLSFYGVGGTHGSLVNASDSLSNLNDTKFPMISYIRYTGETGFGAGTGGGGAVSLASADSNVSNMIGGTAQTMTTTTFNFDGNVGIGTTSPTAQLHIFNQVTTQDTGNSSFPSYDTQVLLKLESGYDFDYDGASGGIHEGGVAIGFHTFNAYNATSLYQNPFEAARITAVCNNSDGAENKGDLLFLTNHNGAVQMPTDSLNTEYERMRITAEGNVGIGTTSPDAKLHVNGNITLAAVKTGGATGVGGGISFRAGAAYAPDSSTGQYNCSILAYGHNANTDGLSINGYDGVSFCTGSSTRNERMRITAEGNVGIGTTSPDHKLHIDGGNTGSTTFNDVVLKLSGTSTNNNGSVGMLFNMREGASGAKSAIFSKDYAGTWNRSSLVFCTNNDTNSNDATLSDAQMVIRETGNVGIGTTSPDSKLHVYEAGTEQAWKGRGVFGNETCAFVCGVYHNNIQIGGHNGALNAWYDIGINPGGGNVGIGTTSPGAKLDVNGTTHLDYMETSSWIYIKGATGSWPLPSTSGYRWNKSWSRTGATWVDSHPIALRIDSGSIYSQNDPVLHTNSDIRIKKDIEDVPDNLSLEMVRNIPCKYYKYIDEGRNIKNNDKKVIGFIAQEVKEVFPLAVDLVNDFEPNENRLLENISWEKIIYNSNNKYKLTTDLQDVSGVKYKFYLINDPSGNVPETKKEVVGNSDNTFTFDNSWNYVFCYGREIDDFHALDKSKLFTLNFSATQELDRKVIALENENAELKTEVTTLKSELAAIKQHLGI